jgi:class 3 adenylate cyclase
MTTPYSDDANSCRTSAATPQSGSGQQAPVGAADPTDALASFVSSGARLALAENEHPFAGSRVGAAAVLYADIVGFTTLAEAVCRDGSQGVERLGEILNGHFGELVGLVLRDRGDVVSFHGDALLAQWPVRNDAWFGASSIEEATRLAQHCADQMQRILHRREIGAGIRLELRIAIGAGNLRELHVGATGKRWVYFVAGAAVRQLRQALALARPGETVLSAEATHAVGDLRMEGEPVHVESLERQKIGARVTAEVPSAGAGAWREFVPAVVRARVLAGQAEWLAELRRVCVLFAGISGLDFDDPHAGERACVLIARLQEALHELRGYFHQFLVDDKGTVLVAAFGVPPFAHEDDAVRALRFGLALRRIASELGLESSIGIARGRMFCGPMGSAARRDYAMIGDTMNLCSRLMDAAGDGILCDGEIQRAAADVVRFEARTPLTLKGRSEHVTVYRVAGVDSPAAQAPMAVLDESVLFGRDQECDALRARLNSLRRQRRADALLLEGEPGLGKSRLLASIAAEARTYGLPVMWVQADAIERNSPYHAWRGCFAALLLADAASTPQTVVKRLHELLGDTPGLQPLISLAAAVLPFDLPANDLTASMSGEVRAANTRRLLAEVLVKTLDRRCAVLIVEDAHWMDSASLGILRDVLGREAPLLTFISSRPREREDELVDELVARRRIECMPLRPLDLAATTELLHARMGEESLPAGLAVEIHARSGGNPMYSEQLLLALRESSALTDTRRNDWRRTLETTLPHSLEEILIRRIDRLEPGQQLCLKVASVIGRVFGPRMLCAVHPLEPPWAQLRADLDSLELAGLAQPLRKESESEWMFRHVIAQDAAYGLLLFAHRRQLHQRAAMWLQSDLERERNLPLLAHHWSQAQNWVRAVECWEEAGANALEAGSDREARRFLDQAAKHAEAGATPITPQRRARWERQHAEACLRLGMAAVSMEHARLAMRLLGLPAAESGPRFVLGLVAALARQCWHLLTPGRLVQSAAELERNNELALANECFSHGCFFVGVMPVGLVGALRHLNLAETLGPSPTLARAYGLSSTTAGILGLPSLARRYRERALATLQTVHSPHDRGLLHVYFCLSEGASANWSEMLRLADEGIQIAGSCSDRRRTHELHSLRSIGQFHSGAISEAGAERAALHTAVADEDDRQLQCWALIELSEVALRQGHFETALAYETAASELLGACGPTERVWLEGVRAATELRRGESERALAAARTALLESSRGAMQGFYALEGLAGAAETLIELSAARSGDPTLSRQATQALRGLSLFAISFPMARSRTALLRARRAALAGHVGVARRAANRALAEASQRRMPFERGLAHIALAALSRARDRDIHLKEALSCLEPLGASREIALARDALRASKA